MNAMDLRRGISMAVDAVVANLKSRARMISTSEEIAQVCNLFFKVAVAIVTDMSIPCAGTDSTVNLIGWDDICKWRQRNW